jgi:hypothetical protein
MNKMAKKLLKWASILVVSALHGFKQGLVILSYLLLLNVLMPHTALEVTSSLMEDVHALAMSLRHLLAVPT